MGAPNCLATRYSVLLDHTKRSIMNTIPKIYTREFPLLLCELWGEGCESFFDYRFHAYPGNIFVLHKGLVDTYRSQAFVDEAVSLFRRKADEDPQFIEHFYKEKLEAYAVLTTYWAQPHLSQSDLLKMCSLVVAFWDAVFYTRYIPELPDIFTEEERETILDLRKRTEQTAHYTTDCINNSVQYLFPQVNKLSAYVSRENIENNQADPVLLQELYEAEVIMVGQTLTTQVELQHLMKKFEFTLEGFGGTTVAREVGGMIAYRGIARGRVHIVRRREQIPEVQDGEVVVAPMAMPYYLPALKKSVAFVTDEGGITSHAAILARELHKPCIIGTKIATTLFQDGDMVEVNGDTGVVFKI